MNINERITQLAKISGCKPLPNKTQLGEMRFEGKDGETYNIGELIVCVLEKTLNIRTPSCPAGEKED